MGEPTRTCIGCRQARPWGELVRIVLADSRVVVDEQRREPGRGAWVHPSRDCVEQADRRRAWGRALRAQGPVDAAAVIAFAERPV